LVERDAGQRAGLPSEQIRRALVSRDHRSALIDDECSLGAANRQQSKLQLFVGYRSRLPSSPSPAPCLRRGAGFRL
jgi:hypothetical protein